jgi:hypothetical protein
VFRGWDWGFQVEDDLKTPIFWGFPLESALKVNKLALRESLVSCVELIVIMIVLPMIKDAIRLIYRGD